MPNVPGVILFTVSYQKVKQSHPKINEEDLACTLSHIRVKVFKEFEDFYYNTFRTLLELIDDPDYHPSDDQICCIEVLALLSWLKDQRLDIPRMVQNWEETPLPSANLTMFQVHLESFQFIMEFERTPGFWDDEFDSVDDYLQKVLQLLKKYEEDIDELSPKSIATYMYKRIKG